MILLRSLVFNAVFYANTALWLLISLPAFAMPTTVMVRVAQGWGRTSLWLSEHVGGIRVRYIGMERIPAGPIILASKHQSFWETFALLTFVREPTFILKRELTWIPFFGWCLLKSGMIPIDRSAGASALKAMTKRSREAVAQGRQILIFPEGTSRPPGAPPDYSPGVASLYRSLGVPCVPVALDAGLVWPRHSFLRRSGIVTVEIAEPIAPGLRRDEFMALLQDRIETATNRMLADAGSPKGHRDGDGI